MSAYHYAKLKAVEAIKVSQSLLKGLKDGSQHNDVKIVLEDGELEANKFVLSVRSEYFSKMFDKDGGFRENQTGDVRISCKKVVMEKILAYLYGGEVSIDGLDLLEVVQFLDMLRLMMLDDAFKCVENDFQEKLKSDTYPLEVCLNSVSVVLTNKLHKTFLDLMGFIWKNIETVTEEHQEYIEKLPRKILKSYFTERKMFPRCDDENSRKHFISAIVFFTIWEEVFNPVGGFKVAFKEEFELVDLTVFNIKDLLGCVKSSKIFSDEKIDAAVVKIHEKEKRCARYHGYDSDNSDYW